MKQTKIISGIVEKIRKSYNPQKIILFGSYAKGNPTEDSDIDLFILKETNKRRDERFVDVKKIIYNPNIRVSVSPIVYTPKELKKRLDMGDDFIKEILNKGVVLYDRDIAEEWFERGKL